jgi:hypothetical protein
MPAAIAFADIIDDETGKTVGSIRTNAVGLGNGGGIAVSLFDGKYQTEVKSKDECRGFILGVQAVLNHMTRGE